MNREELFHGSALKVRGIIPKRGVIEVKGDDLLLNALAEYLAETSSGRVYIVYSHSVNLRLYGKEFVHVLRVADPLNALRDLNPSDLTIIVVLKELSDHMYLELMDLGRFNRIIAFTYTPYTPVYAELVVEEINRNMYRLKPLTHTPTLETSLGENN